MKIERMQTLMAKPYDLRDIKDRARFDATYSDYEFEQLADTVAREIEEQCNLALLSQTITVAFEAVEADATTLDLPIGPVLTGATATVLSVAEDGTTTPITAVRLETGRRPRLRFITAPCVELLVTYTAGFGATALLVPPDLRHAIAEQATRLFDQRGGVDGRAPALSPLTARVIARYRRIAA